MSCMAKTKGKSYEAKTASTIHETLMKHNAEYNALYTTLENENLKPRRDTSSGVFTSSNGDIDLGIAKKYFPFSVECKFHKNYKDINIKSIFRGKLADLERIYVVQVLPQAKKNSLKPLLVFRGNNTDDYVYYHIEDIPSEFVDLNSGPVFSMGSIRVTTFENFLQKFFKIV